MVQSLTKHSVVNYRFKGGVNGSVLYKNLIIKTLQKGLPSIN